MGFPLLSSPFYLLMNHHRVNMQAVIRPQRIILPAYVTPGY